MGCLGPTRWHVARSHHSSVDKGSRSHKNVRRAAIVGPEGGEYIPIRKHKRQDGVPSLELTKEDAVKIQLAALQKNDDPYQDAGVELLYRFADLDPFARSKYFGWNLDLGQFTRFQRVFHIRPFSLLLRHRTAEYLSSLQVSELEWRQRVRITSVAKEQATFEFTLRQRLGGLYDGIFYTQALRAEDPSENALL
ncbi:g11352 [Coccomyxa viridis]|uniref:G11352 protein n=1 Tax=Coccomyxa viridis TaxID=1274662 RepID=A0ABP1GBV8_9CHLO